MRIWMEASLVARSGGPGSRRYAERLAAGIAAAGEDVTVISGPGDYGRARVVAPRWPVPALHVSWALAGGPSIAAVVPGPPPDVVHAVEKAGVPPGARGTPLVVTVHDVWCLRWPAECGRRLRFLIKHSWRRRDGWRLVLTPSEATRSEVVDLGFPAERVRAVWSGVDPVFGPANGEPSRGETVLFVGEASRKKGFDVLVQAVAILRNRGRAGLRLHIRVPNADGLPISDAERSALASALVIEPRTDDAGLAGLYRSAGVVVCPSRAEGFNFPLAEALACGTPVVASDIPVHREVSQGAAILASPGDSHALAEGIERALSGERPTASFTPPRWEETVAKTLSAYREVAVG